MIVGFDYLLLLAVALLQWNMACSRVLRCLGNRFSPKAKVFFFFDFVPQVHLLLPPCEIIGNLSTWSSCGPSFRRKAYQKWPHTCWAKSLAARWLLGSFRDGLYISPLFGLKLSRPKLCRSRVHHAHQTAVGSWWWGTQFSIPPELLSFLSLSLSFFLSTQTLVVFRKCWPIQHRSRQTLDDRLLLSTENLLTEKVVTGITSSNRFFIYFPRTEKEITDGTETCSLDCLNMSTRLAKNLFPSRREKYFCRSSLDDDQSFCVISFYHYISSCRSVWVSREVVLFQY